MFNSVGLLVLGLLACYWWHSGDFKAIALSVASKHCEQFDLQLLDQSVVIKGLWIETNSRGWLSVRRRYQFEFSSTGEQRYQGVLVLLGTRLKWIEIETYQIPDA